MKKIYNWKSFKNLDKIKYLNFKQNLKIQIKYKILYT